MMNGHVQFFAAMLLTKTDHAMQCFSKRLLPVRAGSIQADHGKLLEIYVCPRCIDNRDPLNLLTVEPAAEVCRRIPGIDPVDVIGAQTLQISAVYGGAVLQNCAAAGQLIYALAGPA